MDNTNKKYYKALLKKPYMTSKCGKFKYQMNKKYVIDSELIMCINGYHYTDNIAYIALWYNLDTYDVFEVIPSGNILYDEEEHKYCSSEITIIRQLSDEEIKEITDKELDILVNGHVLYSHIVIARHGRDKDLDILVHDKDGRVRAEVAKHGRDKDLDILVHDKDWRVRIEVARYGRDKDLDILVHDESCSVRLDAKYIKNFIIRP